MLLLQAHYIERVATIHWQDMTTNLIYFCSRYYTSKKKKRSVSNFPINRGKITNYQCPTCSHICGSNSDSTLVGPVSLEKATHPDMITIRWDLSGLLMRLNIMCRSWSRTLESGCLANTTSRMGISSWRQGKKKEREKELENGNRFKTFLLVSGITKSSSIIKHSVWWHRQLDHPLSLSVSPYWMLYSWTWLCYPWYKKKYFEPISFH